MHYLVKRDPLEEQFHDFMQKVDEYCKVRMQGRLLAPGPGVLTRQSPAAGEGPPKRPAQEAQVLL